ncbi:MAG TPA: ATP-binding protein [Burkholderiales bacterium]|jgi:PAS domain S-box-containing protein
MSAILRPGSYEHELAQENIELRRSEQELADFFETAAIGLHWVGPDGIILRVNQAELDLLGYRREEYVGRNIREFHLDPAVSEDILARLTRGERLRDYPAQLRRKDGAIRDVLLNSSALFENGRFIHTRCFTQDVTERRHAQETLAMELAATKQLQETSLRLIGEDDPASLYETILDAAVVIMRSEYASIQMLYPERGELRLLGFRGFNAHAAKFWEWVRPASESTCGMALRSRARCIVADVENCDWMAGSEDLATYLQTGIHAVQSTPLVSRSGHVLGMISTHWCRPHQPSEHELRLLDVLARQAADLIERKRSADALAEADRRKDEFIATLSHELRNPLAPLRNALSLLRLTGDGDAKSVPIREMMERQVNHLVRLVDDLLEVARISRGAFELRKERVEVAAIVRNAVETSEPLIREGRHDLSVGLPQEPLWLDGDPVRLAQILANLLNNAAKYTNAGGRISIKVKRDDNMAVVSVRDNGAGMTPETLAHAFDMFSRGAHSSGLGIGLALARRLAEMHGGTVAAASAGRGNGSEFTIRVPLAADQGAPTAPAAHSVAAVPQTRILVVDDNRDAAESLGMILKFLGADVHIARDGAEAMKAVQAYGPAVVLLDIGMPGMDGYEVARQIRSHQRTHRPTLVALTGWGQEEDRRRACEAGFDHHLVKPADIAALQALLASLHGDAGVAEGRQ